MKKILKIIGRIMLVLGLLAAAGVGLLTITEYRPEEAEVIIEEHPAEAVLRAGEELSVITWNCGYGALGDNADFFMDGGTSVYTADRERVRRNLEGMTATLLKDELRADMILLQEVDINSDRSYRTDERAILKQAMPGGRDAFAYNYKALYVPYPLPPIGHVESGLYTLSRADIREAERISLPCPFSWPVRTVNLKRGLLVSRIPLAHADDKPERELVLINLHLEAYDDGAGKEAQTRKLLNVMMNEYAAGNYVIAGGDFNQQFSNVASPYLSAGAPWKPGIIDTEEFEPDFYAYMDTSAATCRSLDKAYAGADPDHFYCYMIDGFIVSSNVQVHSVETVDTRFLYSDHNPVRMTFTLLPERGISGRN